MLYAGIDPGTDKSGIVVFDTFKSKVEFSQEIENEKLLLVLRGLKNEEVGFYTHQLEKLYIETIEGMGLAVGKSTFDTCIWIGRFLEAYEAYSGKNAKRVSRGDEKIIICGARTYLNSTTGKRKGVGDSQIRTALIERFPSTGGGSCPQVGTKVKPGPLYGVSGHCWQALSVLVTGCEIDGLSLYKNS